MTTTERLTYDDGRSENNEKNEIQIQTLRVFISMCVQRYQNHRRKVRYTDTTPSHNIVITPKPDPHAAVWPHPAQVSIRYNRTFPNIPISASISIIIIIKNR